MKIVKTLLKHKKNRDTAFDIIQLLFEREYAIVEFYNIHYTDLDGTPPMYIGKGLIRLKPRGEYDKYTY